MLPGTLRLDFPSVGLGDGWLPARGWTWDAPLQFLVATWKRAYLFPQHMIAIIEAPVGPGPIGIERLGKAQDLWFELESAGYTTILLTPFRDRSSFPRRWKVGRPNHPVPVGPILPCLLGAVPGEHLCNAWTAWCAGGLLPFILGDLMVTDPRHAVTHVLGLGSGDGSTRQTFSRCLDRVARQIANFYWGAFTWAWIPSHVPVWIFHLFDASHTAEGSDSTLAWHVCWRSQTVLCRRQSPNWALVPPLEDSNDLLALLANQLSDDIETVVLPLTLHCCGRFGSSGPTVWARLHNHH